MADKPQTGVTRYELYSVLSTIFLFIFLVHLSAILSADNFIGVVFRILLAVTLVGMQVLFLFFSIWERMRQPKNEDRAA